MRHDTSARKIDPEGAAVRNVLLKFGRPDPRLELAMRPKGVAVSSVQVDVRSLANKDIYSTFREIPPNLDFHPFQKSGKNHLNCSGPRNWKYTTSPSASVVSASITVIAEPKAKASQ